MDNTGKQVDDAVDYALANSNRNLLDNPFFTIRQMGTSGVTGVGYAVDRWKNTGGANLTQTPRSPYGITFASSSGYQVDQALWAYPAEYLDGETLTISVMTSGGSIAKATGTFTAISSTAAKVAVTSADGNFTVGLYYIPSARAVPFVRITTPTAKFPVNAAILAVKLEKGSYSTLANDMPMDDEELTKCQRYFVRMRWQALTPVCLALASTSTNLNGLIITPVAMRETSTYSIASSGSLTTPAGNTATPTNVTASYGNQMRVQFSASGITSGQVYQLHTGNAAKYIDISADI